MNQQIREAVDLDAEHKTDPTYEKDEWYRIRYEPILRWNHWWWFWACHKEDKVFHLHQTMHQTFRDVRITGMGILNFIIWTWYLCCLSIVLIFQISIILQSLKTILIMKKIQLPKNPLMTMKRISKDKMWLPVLEISL